MVKTETRVKVVFTKAGEAYSATQAYRLHDYIVLDGVTIYACKKVDPATMTCVGHPLTDTAYWDKFMDIADFKAAAEKATASANAAAKSATDAAGAANTAKTNADKATEAANTAASAANTAKTNADTATTAANTAAAGAEKVNATITADNVLKVTDRTGVEKTLELMGQAEAATIKTELAGKFDKANIVQELGNAEDKVVSQKEVSEKVSDLADDILQTNNNLGSLKLREFSKSVANKKGDKVKYKGGLYEFIEDADAGEFDLTKVKSITYFDIFNDKAVIADNKQAIAQTKENSSYVISKDIELFNNATKYCGKFIVGSEVVISEDIDPTHMKHVIVPISSNDVIIYKNTYYDTNQVMAFLDAENKVISIVTKDAPQFEVSAIAPEGSVKVFLNIHLGFTYKATIKSYESVLRYIVPSKEYGFTNLGCTNISGVNYDYNIIISYGQSLCVGDGILQEETDSPLNCYMLGDTAFNKSSYLVGTELKRLHVNSGRSSFTPSISATSHVASILNRIQNVGNKKFIALGAGLGGYSVAQLMDKARYVDVNTNEFYFPNLSTYEPYKNLFAALKRIKQIADAENKTCGVVAFVWIQGEGDAWGDGKFNTDTTTCSCAGNKEEWLKRVKQLHKDVADDLNTYLVQDVSPAWFIHNIQGGFIPKYSGVLEAQTEIIDNVEYFSLNPAYQLPNLKDQHLTGNGYRWYGELIAKSIIDVLLYNIEPRVVRFKSAHIMYDKRSICLYFSVPVPPLKHDKGLQADMQNYGFYVKNANNDDLEISNIEIYSNYIILRMSGVITESITVGYATNFSTNKDDTDIRGAGNICDSSNDLSYYINAEETAINDSNPVQYVPKSENGESIVGKRYSLSNYCIAFEVEVKL